MNDFNTRLSSLSSKAIIALLSAGLISGNGIAQVPNPEPTTYTDVSVPQLTGWNDANIVTLDGMTGATEKSHIYESAAAIVDPTKSSVAAVFWELDNGSGRAPGIQVVTDDFDVPTNNCIMASGELESVDFPGTIVPKTCSDPQGSSKRYFLEMTSSDVPIDMAFDLGVKDIRYKGVKDPETDGGEALAEFKATYGIGRIYRVIQKVINNTEKRIASYKFELGTGLGDAFLPLTFEEHGVGFEMLPLVPREFLEGETGAPDIAVWDSLRFATVSPKMFDDGSRARFDPGFLDHNAAGFLPPQLPAVGVEKSQYIDSGTSIVDGIIGSMTPNYFNIADTQGVLLPGNILGYQLSDSLIPEVIGEYNTNEIGGESDSIVAIWDGSDWRSGRAGLDGLPGLDDLDPDAADNYGIIPDAQLIQWAAKPLGLDLDTDDETDPDFVRYEVILSDDLSGLNTDFFIYIGDKLLDDTGELILDSITLRLTANSVEAVIGDVPGSEDPPWGSDLDASRIDAPTLASYMPVTGTPIAINDITTTVEDDPSTTITIDVLENDLLDGAAVVPADGFITITTPPEDGIATIVGNEIEYTPDADFVGTDFISYTYTLTAGAVVSNIATIKIIVEAAPIPDQPLAVNDSATTFKDIPVTLDVLVNDELYNDAPNTVVVSINNDALNGVASVAGDNTIVYTPGADFVGFERFTYVVTVDGIVSNSALVTIKVDSFGIPDAINDITVTLENDPVTIDVLENDVLEGVPVIPADGFITITKAPQNGSAAVVDQKVEYTPDAGFTGTDLISYTYTLTATGDVSNTAIVTIIVDAAPIPDQPLAINDSTTTFKNTAVTLDVLDNDELNNDAPSTVVVSINNAALNGVARVEDDNTIIYTPGIEFVGIERFTYVVTVDGIISSSALVTIRVDEPVVVVPVATGGSGRCSLSYNPDGKIDPLLPGIVLVSLIYLGWRSRKNDAR